MQKFFILIHSNMRVQNELEETFKEFYPEIKLSYSSRKLFDAFQTTTLVISGTALLINIINLILKIKNKHPDSKTDIEINSIGSERTLKINTTINDINVEKIVNDFLSND